MALSAGLSRLFSSVVCALLLSGMGCFPRDDLAEYSKNAPPVADAAADASPESGLPGEVDASQVDADAAPAALEQPDARAEAGTEMTGTATTPPSALDPAGDAGTADAADAGSAL